MLALTSLTRAKLQDVRILVVKDRAPDSNVGAKLVLSRIQLPAAALAMLSPDLPKILFRPAVSSTKAKQQELDGVAPALEPSDVGSHAGKIRWSGEGTGYTITIDFGVGGPSNIVLKDARVYGTTVKALESGGAELGVCVDVPDVSPAIWAKLPSLKTAELQVLLTPPEMTEDEQQALDELDGKPAAKAKPTNGTKPADWPFGTNGEPQAGTSSTPPESDVGGPAEAARRRRPKDATGAFLDAHAPRRRRGKGDTPAVLS